MTRVSEALREAARRLAEISDAARLDAELLMAEALGVSRSDMLLRHMDEEAPPAFAPLIERRALHEPVAYILGRKEFYGLELEVTPAVLIPRADSETLIDAARETFAGRPPKRVLDLGTGSGALLLAALGIWPQAEGLGVDSSSEALLVAVRNAQRHADASSGAHRGPAKFVQRDWREPGWSADLGRFELILCNPPYVEEHAELGRDVRDWEPARALFAGPEGLDDYRVLIPQLDGLLLEHGAAIFEIGAAQADRVGAIAAEAGFESALHRDLAGRPRALVLRRGRVRRGK